MIGAGRAGTALLVVAIAVAAGCVHSSAPPSPESSRLQVRLASSQADALKQVRKAFLDEGFDVDPPLRHDSVLSTNTRQIARGIKVTYVAIVHTADSASVVILSGSLFNQIEAAWDQAMLRIPKRRETPVTRDARGEEQVAWSELQKIANRLRDDPPAP